VVDARLRVEGKDPQYLHGKKTCGSNSKRAGKREKRKYDQDAHHEVPVNETYLRKKPHSLTPVEKTPWSFIKKGEGK